MKIIALIIATTVIILKVITVITPNVLPRTPTVDTVRVVTTIYDTITSRAADTVRVVVKSVDSLTEQDVVRLVCGQEFTYGDKRDQFSFNVYGMVFCPTGKKAGPSE